MLYTTATQHDPSRNESVAVGRATSDSPKTLNLCNVDGVTTTTAEHVPRGRRHNNNSRTCATWKRALGRGTGTVAAGGGDRVRQAGPPQQQAWRSSATTTHAAHTTTTRGVAHSAMTAKGSSVMKATGPV